MSGLENNRISSQWMACFVFRVSSQSFCGAVVISTGFDDGEVNVLFKDREDLREVFDDGGHLCEETEFFALHPVLFHLILTLHVQNKLRVAFSNKRWVAQKPR